jgi:DNA-directed RNA polymerase specialized sigma subunit
MRTINSGKKVKIHNKEVYINIDDGSGFHKIFEIMAGTIKKLSLFNSNINNLEFEDAYQNVCVFILEGILKYSHDKNTALSSFLYTYVRNKIIDFTRNKKSLTRGKTFYICVYDDVWVNHQSTARRIELTQVTDNWDDKWKNIIFRIFVKGESINDVAASEKITRWGLSRAIKRKFKAAQNI